MGVSHLHTTNRLSMGKKKNHGDVKARVKAHTHFSFVPAFVHSQGTTFGKQTAQVPLKSSVVIELNMKEKVSHRGSFRGC